MLYLKMEEVQDWKKKKFEDLTDNYFPSEEVLIIKKHGEKFREPLVVCLMGLAAVRRW
jgi:hypothetical protein